MERSVVIALIVVGVVLLLGGACIALLFGY
jgi:flagellar basal body-associated protein FliL